MKSGALLPGLPAPRADDLPGTPAVRLEQHLRDAPIQVAPATIAGRTQPGFPRSAGAGHR